MNAPPGRSAGIKAGCILHQKRGLALFTDKIIQTKNGVLLFRTFVRKLFGKCHGSARITFFGRKELLDPLLDTQDLGD